MEDLIQEAVRRSARYLKGLEQRSVAPPPEAVKRLSSLDAPLQDEPTAPMKVLADLDDIGSAATVASAGSRYFGFVTGGTLPAALAASYLAGAWDQNAVFHVTSPTTAFLEEICRRWLVALFGLPPGAGIGFVPGATMANFSALAAARHALLGRLGWDVEARGLFGAPPITVIVGAEVHVSVLKALSLLGLGRERVIRVATDGHGRMRPDAVPPLTEPAIICIQAGNVNTGSFDPAADICELAKASDSWVHVSFGTPDRTRQVVRRVQEDGTCWCGGTEWQGQAAMRIRVSSWATTGEDVERSLRAMIRLASDR